jgi:hypothetical protein
MVSSALAQDRASDRTAGPNCQARWQSRGWLAGCNVERVADSKNVPRIKANRCGYFEKTAARARPSASQRNKQMVRERRSGFRTSSEFV